ncbi:MAG: LPS assembly protein LptD, partial [Pseudomonadota bacterium]
MLRFIFPLLAGLITVSFPVSSRAGDAWDLCRAPSFIFSSPEITGSNETRVEAQSIIQTEDEQLLLTGEVSVLQPQQRIRADEVKLSQEGQSILANGNVQFENQTYRMYSDSVSVDKKNNRARFEQPRFQLNEHHGNGEAERIEQLDESRSQFRNLLYTTCDPDSRVWHLRASEMEIDDASGRGTAKHTTLYFQDIPFFYFPYFQFPIDDRRLSGILTPRIGYSESQGGNLEVPVYWNIAANYDATITPAWFSERGTQLNTENRYLFESNAGQLDLSYLDDDDIEDSRWFQRFRHDSSLGYDIKANLLLTEVSDEDFFDDFDNIAPEYNNLNHLDRHLRLSRQGERWHGEVLWQHYQTPDRSSSISSRPYNRLPRAAIDGPLDPWTDNASSLLSAEWVNFERDDSITGQRGHLVSETSWRASQSWYFFEPALQLNFTDYHLDNNTGDNSIDRAIPILSLDSGLIFERLIGTQNQWLQTLEPRLFLLSTPFEDQDDIPDFDTALLSSTYDNLFRNNRFSGADRIGDAKQITFGLASRIFDNDSGDELFQFRT